jgi:hypothetical protein
MNPDRLFDYLDDRLPAAERAALERQLISDRQLQRELAVARQIHAGMRGDLREVLLPAQTEVDAAARGRKLALRVGAVFILLMVVNVGVGLWMIARHETKNPNRKLLETQMRQQITKALEHAATTLTPVPSLGANEITVPAAAGKLEVVADEVVTIASQFGGSAAKGLPDQHRLSVLVDLPSSRELEFRAAVASIGGGGPVLPAPESASPATSQGAPTSAPAATLEKKSFVVQIVEAAK